MVALFANKKTEDGRKQRIALVQEGDFLIEKEKRRARDRYPNDSHAYTDEKDAWIQRALSRQFGLAASLAVR
jgi:hypothetical protein